jgi:enoyl-CoA hydratase
MVRAERRATVLWLTLNRPDVRNALNFELATALRDLLHAADSDPETRVVVLRGAGRSFCAGGDITTFSTEGDAGTNRRYLRRTFEMFWAIEYCSKPVIAAVHGFALGGGLEITLAADLVVAARGSEFGTPEPGLGLTPGFGVVRLAQVVGLHNAKFLVLTGNRISAQEAQRIGIVNILCDDDQLEEQTEVLAQRLAANAPLALAAGKASLNRELRGGYEHSIEMVTMLQLTADMVEGIEAFKAKRQPRFKGS